MKIAKKLPLLISVSALINAAAVGAISFVLYSDIVLDSKKEDLGALVAGHKSEVTHYLKSIKEDITFIAESEQTATAIKQFNTAWDELNFNQTTYLQRFYIDNNPHPTGEKEKLDYALDGSLYSQIHGRFHPWFRNFLNLRGYYDIFLFDMQGNLLYTVFKEADYATNVTNGKWKDTDLGNAFRSAANDTAKAKDLFFFDFKAYAPSNGAPASFISTPVYDNGRKTGVLVFQMPVDRINSVIQVYEGLGQTGNTYLVGEDLLMRSNSRFSEESTILKKQVNNYAVRHALKGETGAKTANENGKDLIEAFTPVDFLGTRWAMVATIDKSEVMGTLYRKLQTIILVTLAVAAIISAIGWAFVRSIVNPLKRINVAMNNIAEGKTNIEIIDAARSDEIGELASAASELRKAVETSYMLKQMVDNMPPGVMAVDITNDFTINYMNSSAIKTLGELEEHLPMTVDKVMGSSIDIFHKNPQHQRELLRSKDNLPHKFKLKLGSETLGATASAIYDNNKNYTGAMLTWEIITEKVKLADEFEQNVKGIVNVVASAATQLSQTAQGMSDIIQQSMQLANDASNAAGETSGNVQTVASAAEELSASVREIATQMSKANSLVHESTDKTETADKMAFALGEATDKVNSVMSMISSISEQINLLALNATIESARAGEAGKGFAVVANEVKGLASETDKSIADIQKVVEEMRGASSDIIKALGEIKGSINQISDASSSVASAVEEQTATTNEIARSMQTAASGTKLISDNLSNVSSSTMQASTASEQMLEAANELSRQAEGLNGQVDAFLQKMRAS